MNDLIEQTADVPASAEPAAEHHDFTVIATNPQEMAAAQKRMVEWATSKIGAVQAELSEARDQLAIAIKRKWSQTAWKRLVKVGEQKIDFYVKIKMALEAGYYIVPPFPLDIFAVRTKRDQPVWDKSDDPRDLRASADLLPAGEGRYVASQLEVGKNERYGRNADNTTDYDNVVDVWYNTRNFQPVDFPFKLAKVEIMEETGSAFALKIFDQFGVLPKAPKTAVVVKRDPIICGQILAPHKKREPVTFFVAWWLDTRTL